MAYYSTCEHCGAHLDPGERCMCTEEDKCQKKNKRTSPNISEAGFLDETGESPNCSCRKAESASLRPEDRI